MNVMSKQWTSTEWDLLFPQITGQILLDDLEYHDCVFLPDAGQSAITDERDPDTTTPSLVGMYVHQYRAYLPNDLTHPLQCHYSADTILATKVVMNLNFAFTNCSYLIFGFWGYLYPYSSNFGSLQSSLFGDANKWDGNSPIPTGTDANGLVQLVTPSGAVWGNQVAASHKLISGAPHNIAFGKLRIATVSDNDSYGSVFGVILPITNDDAGIIVGQVDIPFNGGSDSGTGGGQGTFSAPSNDRGDKTGNTVLNIFTGGGASSVVQKHNAAIYGNGINVFKMNTNALGQMVKILYGGNFIDKWLQAMYNPLSSILAVHMIPATLCPLTYNGGTPPQINVTAGGYNFFLDPPSEIGQLLPQDRVDTICVNHIGSFDFQKYFDAYPDFAPYTQIYLHLPYCGVLQIDTNSVMHGYISVDYVCDTMNGNVCAYITCSDREGRTEIKYTATGNAAYSIPMFAENQSGAEMGKLVSNVVGGALMAATGNAAGFAAAGAELVGASIAGVQHNTQITGTVSGNIGMISDTQCFLEIIRPQWVNPEKYAILNAIPIEIGGTISDIGLIGKTVIDKIELDNISCTDAEKIEIAEILAGGIFIASEE